MVYYITVLYTSLPERLNSGTKLSLTTEAKLFKLFVTNTGGILRENGQQRGRKTGLLLVELLDSFRSASPMGFLNLWDELLIYIWLLALTFFPMWQD